MRRQCTVADCARLSVARGWCEMHYRRWARTGSPLGVAVSPIERFSFHVSEDPESGCWLWTGWVNRGGYGRFSTGRGRHYQAHRWRYEFEFGPVPSELDMDHLCRVRRCVNPKHLEPVTRAENLRRGKQTRDRSNVTHCPQGHAYDPANTYLYRGTRACRQCRRVRTNAWRARRKALTPRTH